MESDNRIIRGAITGGPCSGKTTAKTYLQQKFSELGFNVILVPEAATLAMEGGISPFNIGFTNFQKVIFDLINSLEDNFLNSVKYFPKKDTIIIYDRGLPDGGAYVSAEEFGSMLRAYNCGMPQIRDLRYDAAFHLRSAAIGAEEFYTLANNKTRSEDIDQARDLDERTLAMWLGHPHLRVIDNSTPFDKKLKRLYQHMCSVIGIPAPLEKERKFLVEPFDVSRYVERYQTIDIEQTYLLNPVPDEELRIRKWGQNGYYIYFKTRKRKIAPGVRIETEKHISDHEYATSLGFKIPETKTLCKNRSFFVHKEQYMEYDAIFGGPHLLEVELTDMSDRLIIPDYIKVIKEVTDDPLFSNRRLAEAI